MRRRHPGLFLLLLVPLLAPWLYLHADPAGPTPATPPGPFTQTECLGCHAARDPALLEQWRAGPHAVLSCLSCHGERHGRLPAARADTTCTQCHDGEVAHSYATSKHGVLVQLERPVWEAPLRRGEYRAPGCGYCHLHAGDHGDSMDGARGPAVRQWVCSGCHAPRFVADQFAAGAELLAIGRRKAEEAEAVAARHPQGAAAPAQAQALAQVQQHLRNLRLGAGHQSPDYQWWHGQPALDGDLIRLREAVARAQRAAVPDGDDPSKQDQTILADRP